VRLGRAIHRYDDGSKHTIDVELRPKGRQGWPVMVRDPDSGDPWYDLGIGGVRERPQGPALLDEWLRHQRMGEGERRVLLTLIDAYPEALSNDDLCDRTGYSPTASTMGVILSKLRKLGLVEKGARRVAPEFYEATR
jgi:hypothetical protein